MKKNEAKSEMAQKAASQGRETVLIENKLSSLQGLQTEPSPIY